MTERTVFAKSANQKGAPEASATLKAHTSSVIQSFRTIFGYDETAPTRFAHEWLSFFQLESSIFKQFYNNGVLACIFHDIGKANSGFQDMVTGKNKFQIVRHEHLSGLLLWLPDISDWIGKIKHIDIRIVFSAVVSHHLKTGSDKFAEPLNPDLYRIFEIYPDSIRQIFQLAVNYTAAESVENLTIPKIWDFEGRSGFDPYDLKEKINKTYLKNYKRLLKRDTAQNSLLTAVRAALIVADSAGSAIVREGKDMREWLNAAFNTVVNSQYIENNVIQPRIKELQMSGLSFWWNDFQDVAETLPSKTLLISPCGSGKTLAAWRWIKGRLSEKAVGKVIFLYPTRATATEGFRDYVSWAPEADAGLIHGTAGYDLEGMFNQPEDARTGKDFTTEDRLYALGYWPRNVFSATVDQFLGFMQHTYRSVCLLPVLADSVVVFDEVHSFDKSLFSALKRFLKHFDIPVLCMTASLPGVRRDELITDCGLALFPDDGFRFNDLDAKASMPRYRITVITPEDSEIEALNAFESGKRVLWVVNKVAECQSLARRLNVICYHSRFRLQDRKKQHQKVIRAFQQTKNPVLAITTQVCEMSLDLDADVVISQNAPITSMIQRMGRCNRHARPENNKLGDVYFYPPEDENPYKIEELNGVDHFLDALDGKTASQKMLETLLQRFGPEEAEVEKYAAFLESGPWAASREAGLRDQNDFTVSAVLNTDIREYYDLKRCKAPADGLMLPVPKRFVKPGRFPAIAPSAHYDPEYGFFDYPLEDIL